MRFSVDAYVDRRFGKQGAEFDHSAFGTGTASLDRFEQFQHRNPIGEQGVANEERREKVRNEKVPDPADQKSGAPDEAQYREYADGNVEVFSTETERRAGAFEHNRTVGIYGVDENGTHILPLFFPVFIKLYHIFLYLSTIFVCLRELPALRLRRGVFTRFSFFLLLFDEGCDIIKKRSTRKNRNQVQTNGRKDQMK